MGNARGALAELEQRLAASRLAPGLCRDYCLAAHSTYRTGGRASLSVTVSSRSDLDLLADALAAVQASHASTGSPSPRVAVLVIGRGSNLLVADRGFGGLAVLLDGEFASFDFSSTRARAGSAVPLPVLARACAPAGLTGFEWAVGVPGSVGGAVRMNAGGHGSDMKACLQSATIINLHTGKWRHNNPFELELGYRTSNVSASEVVVEATIQLQRAEPAAIREQLSEIVAWRRANQPGGRNAGSVFTNPAGDAAGRLIDQSGAKGLRVGGAQVSTKHANFIQASPGARASDVVSLMREVRRRVSQNFGVDLEVETCLVGFETSELPA